MKRIPTIVTTALLGLTLTLGACAPTPLWHKDGVTAQQWERDRYGCERDTRMSAASFGGIYTRDYNAQQFFNRCLQANGYTRVK